MPPPERTTAAAVHSDIPSTKVLGSHNHLPPINTDMTAALHTPLPTHHEEEEQEMTSSPTTTTQQPPLQIPFFSFTRTQEGSSLTTDVKTLAALFPPEERHLLVCCADLDLNSYLDEGCCEFGSDDDGEDGECDDVGIGELKCLQIDLRSFGLGKFYSIQLWAMRPDFVECT